jgi:hypothetical protein
MKAKILIPVLILAAIAAVVLADTDTTKTSVSMSCPMACAGRYQIAAAADTFALYRLDTQTGEVLALHVFRATPNIAVIQHEWVEVTPPSPNQ